MMMMIIQWSPEYPTLGYLIQTYNILLTDFTCSNTNSNHKLQPAVSRKGGGEPPQEIKNLASISLPVTFKNQKNTWMNSEIF
jgi:hypothetical protein